ncbi:phage portal protein, HK97 family [Polaromonas sp. OV174]|uniref:phage portal protein n=1 Tax=Polaromonas sp. OV174 TaxID=1855300 RepID=UPI0008F18FB5|nr:phage portal protein [Polaromonas sp. OV174]SFB74259.1 phage portal protein, HK97 family [Polaromonas sp. OV174]
MGFLARGIEQKSVSVTNSLELFREIYGGRTSKAGPTINLENAFKVATFFACLRVLSQGCAQVPFKLFREYKEGGLNKIEPARDHRHYDLVATKPNDWQTSYEFREQMVIHAGLGNAYAWKSLVVGGKVAEMIMLDPARVTPEQPNEFEAPSYKYTLKDGRTVTFDASVIWHVRGPSWSGFAGMDILALAREALGLSIATEETHAKLHAKGVRPSGTYSVDGNLSPQQYKDLKAWILAEMAGAENAGAPMILDRGAKWLQSAMTGLDAQHLETRNYQGAEICRFLGVLPSKVGFTDKAATYASAEQFAIQHVVDSLGPWYARIEQSADINLLTEKERGQGYYFKFVAAGLLRGALKDQGEFFARMLGSGGSRQVLTQDEVRALLEFNPQGGEAALLHAPQGTQPAKTEPSPT